MGLKRAAHHDVSRGNLPSTGSPSQSNKKPKFDHRNPSTLAQETPEEDAILDLDEIGRGGIQAKRNAVELDGYSSDSSNEGFDARANTKAKNAKAEKRAQKSKDEEDNDMFADIEEEEVPDGDDDEDITTEGKKPKKEVRFLDADEIEGQVKSSEGGGHVSADFSMKPTDTKRRSRDNEEASDSSDGEEGDAVRDATGADIDDELGAGSKKKHAPRLDGFNMRDEAEEGQFDATGNFVRKAKDPFEVHDAWLEGNSSKASMRKAAEAEEDRERERRERNIKDDAMPTSDLLAALIRRMQVDETVLEALQRLNKGTEKKKKQSFKRNRRKDEMETDTELNGHADPVEAQRRETVEAITGAANHILSRGDAEIYDAERALLERQYKRETGEAWVDEQPNGAEANREGVESAKQWQYRWADARDGGQIHGPYDETTMKAWVGAGYFGDGVEFRQAGLDTWSRTLN